MHRRSYCSQTLESASGTEEYASAAWEKGLHLHFHDAAGRNSRPGVVHVLVEDTYSERLAAGSSWSAAPLLPRSSCSEVSSQ